MDGGLRPPVRQLLQAAAAAAGQDHGDRAAGELASGQVLGRLHRHERLPAIVGAQGRILVTIATPEKPVTGPMRGRDLAPGRRAAPRSGAPALTLPRPARQMRATIPMTEQDLTMTDANGALIYTMVLAAASNGDMTDREVRTPGGMVSFLPVFRPFDHERLDRLTRATV